MKERKKVDISELRKVAVENRPDVNVWEVMKEANDLYEAVKLVGIQNVVDIEYRGNDKSENGIPNRVGALAAYIMMHKYQMSDSASSVKRLGKHFGDISLDTILGYRFEMNRVALTSLSVTDIIAKYVGDNDGKKKKVVKKTWAKSLYEMIVKGNREIDVFSLWSECENLYNSIITVGLEDTIIWLDNGPDNELELKGVEIPERMRAFALFVVVHMYRLRDDDIHMKNLEDRYGLRTSVRTILGDTDIFMDRLDNMQCLSLNEIVGRYFKEEKKRRVKVTTICFNVPYKAIEMKLTDTEEFQNIYDLWEALDSFYKASKIYGIDDVRVKYLDANRDEVKQSGRKIPARIRAFAEEAVIYMYRMNDSYGSRSRLERHLGLEYPSRYILGDTNVVCNSNNKSMPCITLKELLEKL